jgi:hypothetical protein
VRPIQEFNTKIGQYTSVKKTVFWGEIDLLLEVLENRFSLTETIVWKHHQFRWALEPALLPGLQYRHFFQNINNAPV